MIRSFYNRKENKLGKHCWKGRKASNQHFLLFLLYFAPFNPFPNKPWFLRVCSTRLLKTLWEKEKLLVRRNFSFSQCFLPVWRNFCHFHPIQNCRLQTLSVWKSLKFVVWERVNRKKNHIFFGHLVCHPQKLLIWASPKFCRLVKS